MPQSTTEYSFIRLYAGGGPSLPIIPMRSLGMVSPAMIMCPGESYSYYVPGGVGGISLTDGANGYGAGASVAGVATTVGNHSIVNFNFPSVPDGVYQMLAGGGNSSFVEVVNDMELANSISAIFEVSHNKILGNIYYPYAGAGYKQRMRLRCSVLEVQPEINVEGYEETNTGRLRNLQGVMRKYFTIQTVDYSREDHDAAALMSIHDNISLNGIPCTRRPSGSYKSSMVSDIPVSNGEFSLYSNNSTVLLRS